MVKFSGGVKIMVCQCSGQGKIIDAEKENKRIAENKQIDYLMQEGYKAYKEGLRQINLATECFSNAKKLRVMQVLQEVNDE